MILGVIAFGVSAYSEGQTNAANISSSKIVWFVANGDFPVREGKSDTNGLNCALVIDNDQAEIGLITPVCVVYAHSATTNRHNSCWQHYSTNYLEVELLDSVGNPVARTALGENYKYFSSSKQVEAVFFNAYNRSHRRTVQGFRSIEPKALNQFTRISLPKLFDLKQPGEYMLKVRMRLLERDLAKPLEGKFTITLLPEVTAKVQIQSEYIPPENLLPNDQTNSSAK